MYLMNSINNLKLTILILTFCVFVAAIPMLNCPEHSFLNRCMTRCPVTCSNFKISSTIKCLPVCQIGCQCKDGFIKISKSAMSACVKTYECRLYTVLRTNSINPIRWNSIVLRKNESS